MEIRHFRRKKWIWVPVCLWFVWGLAFPACALEPDAHYSIWQEAYQSIMLNVEETLEQDGPADGWYFELLDLNTDGIPELVCVNAVGARLLSAGVRVFTYDPGTAQIREVPVQGSCPFIWIDCFYTYRSMADGSLHFLMNLESYHSEYLFPGGYLEDSAGHGGVAELTMDGAGTAATVSALRDAARDWGIEAIYGGEAFTKDPWQDGCITQEIWEQIQTLLNSYELLDTDWEYFSRYELLVPDERTWLIAETSSLLYSWEPPAGQADSRETEAAENQGDSYPAEAIYEQIFVESPYTKEALPVSFSESCFMENSYVYNHQLAWLSLCMELSAGTAGAGDTWGQDGSDSDETALLRSTHIRNFFDKLSFDSVTCSHYGASLNDTGDKAACTIATKRLSTGYTLIAVAVRGLGYGAEWVSNFHVDPGTPYHTGFDTSAREIYLDVLKTASQSGGPVKIWITGYSRGAAIANLLAAELVDYAGGVCAHWTVSDPALLTASFSENDVFTYTFATPQGVTDSADPHAARYANIFNIVNPGDVVPCVAPSGWGFTRFGTTKYLNADAGEKVFDVVNKVYQVLTGDVYNAEAIVSQKTAVDALMNILLRRFPTTASAGHFLAVIREFLEFANTRKYVVLPSGEDAWRAVTVDDYYGTLIGRYGNEFFTAYQYSDAFLEYTSDGRLLMSMVSTDTQEMLRLFFLLCEIHDLPSENICSMVADLLSTEDMGDILDVIFGLPEGAGGLAEAHVIATYLSWMSLGEQDAFAQ